MYQQFLKEMEIVNNEDNDKGHLERVNFILNTLEEKMPKYKYASI